MKKTTGDVKALILEKFRLSQITPLIDKQLGKCALEYQMTSDEIYNCIKWYSEVMHKPMDPIYGIAFVWSIRDQVKRYNANVEAQDDQKLEQAEIVKQDKIKKYVINLKEMPKSHVPHKQY